MKVLVAIDSFKGSLSSQECSRAIAEGIKIADQQAEVLTIPLADGGEGTVEALVQATQGRIIQKTVIGPLGQPVLASYGVLGEKGEVVIEVASVCGLPLIPTKKKNPLVATTYGIGELILGEIENGCRNFIIGLGGSATNDAGIGMLQALGYSFLDEEGCEVGYGGGELKRIQSINASGVTSLLKECTFKIACDVNNPLFGLNGAAYVFGPQKGATEQVVKELDEGLKHFAQIAASELKRDIHNIPGAGAAGGLGAAFEGFLNGQLLSGIELLMDTIRIEEKMAGIDFVITGEGRLDRQTAMGKTPVGIAQCAGKYAIPVIALAGEVTKEAETLHDFGITSFFSIVNGAMTIEEAMNPVTAYANLKTTSEQLFRLVSLVKQSKHEIKCEV